ncbi:hypothetical protein ESZ91_05435 [Candidatus Borkfalkia ceftriaxoniphila]|uniref:Uncharacterized protein n=1 Tax=Candidatus Borkfalkia ceftriaxoniphila TaxID=2508949 RepID=A0A4Q2KES7_9FIRM|nr:hypothetical protein [Candidatus Borkfalkia ceftriaxoniphila]RXZ61833.1 hypothetical protein ESZ91_05435 [Candidatus Borkfalkia ceftriaxoniphila]
MKKKYNWIITSILSLALLFGICFTGTFAAEESAPESYITVNKSIAGSSAADKMSYVNTPLTLANGLNLYVEAEMGQYTDSVMFFGLFADKTDSAPYAHKSFMMGSQEIKTFFSDAATPVDNGKYMEDYWNTYYYNRVMYRFEIKSNGDVNVYARSTEDPSTYVGDNAQITTETLITTQAGYYSALASDEQIYAGLALRAGANDAYKLYSLEVRDGAGNQIFTDNGFLKYTTEAYVRSEGIDAAIEAGALAVPEIVEESSLSVNSKMTMGDVMVYADTKVQGGAEITLDMKMNRNEATFFFGVFTDKTNSNFYNTHVMQMSSSAIVLPYDANAADNGNYNENTGVEGGLKFVDRIRLRMNISASGTLNVYVSSIEGADSYTGMTAQESLQDILILTQENLYSKEMTDGGYFGFAFRAPAANQDVVLYNLKIADKDGVTLFQDDFSKVLTDSYIRTGGDALKTNVENGGAVLRVKNVQEAKPVFNFAALKREGYLDETFHLTPTVDDMPEGGELSVIVKDAAGNAIAAQADGTFKFTAQGIYTAEFAVTVNEEIILQDSVKVYIKNHSTQPNAEANFDKGYFNGDLWAITEKGVAVKDGALIIAGGTFRTKGFSEICYFTFDVTSMKAGSSSFDLIFGQDGVGYALRFTDKTSVEFITPEGSREIAVGKNFVEAALAGKKVTLRLELASDKAMLYGMIEDESEETLETALCTLEGIRLVGSIGVTVPEGSRITIDDVQFVNMAGVDNPNTDPSKPSDPGENPGEDPGEKPGDEDPKKKGCAGTAVGFSIAGGTAVVLAAAVLCFRKKKKI